MLVPFTHGANNLADGRSDVKGGEVAAAVLDCRRRRRSKEFMSWVSLFGCTMCCVQRLDDSEQTRAAIMGDRVNCQQAYLEGTICGGGTERVSGEKQTNYRCDQHVRVVSIGMVEKPRDSGILVVEFHHDTKRT